MISYKEAEKKAREYYKDYEITQKWEDDMYYNFCFGIIGEPPLPGMEEVRINKATGKLSTYNPFHEMQMNAPKITEDLFKK